MAEIIVKIPIEVSEELLAKLKRGICALVSLRLARKLMLKERAPMHHIHLEVARVHDA